MVRLSNGLTMLAALTMAGLGGGCSTPKSITDLNPAGPPTLIQLLVATDDPAEQDPTAITVLGIADGSHPDVDKCDFDGQCADPFTCDTATNHCVDSNGDFPGVKSGIIDPNVGIEIHAIFKEIIAGQTMEQFACACTQTATATCEGGDAANNQFSNDPLHCTSCGDDPSTDTDETGKCFDPDNNGLPDVAALLPGLATVTCDGGFMWTSDVGSGYYTPSGNQIIPIAEGLGGLGPALVLFVDVPLPSDADCGITFSDSVKDKDGNSFVAPSFPMTWHTESFGVAGTSPKPNATGAPGSTIKTITITLDGIIDPATVNAASVTLTPAVAGATVAASDDKITIKLPTTGLPAGHYTVTVKGSVADTFGKTLGQDFTFSFDVT